MTGLPMRIALRNLVAGLLPLLSSPLLAQTYYVSPAGLYGNAGTLESPISITRVNVLAGPGVTFILRGGTYVVKAVLGFSASGTAARRVALLPHPGEHPVLDGDSMAIGGSNRVISLSGSYWTIAGLEIMRAGDNGMRITGLNNVVERCSFHDNSDTGLQIDNGGAYNQIIDCDSYNNADPTQGNADGFAVKMDVGTGNSFSGCRAWYNSDDGWDGYLRGADGVTTTFDRCWSFANGYLAGGSPSAGNGNGFKMGGSDDKTLSHNVILTRCLAFANRMKGFDQNNDRGSITLLNCSGTLNGTNYSVAGDLTGGNILTVKNCVCLGILGNLGSRAVQATNSWMAPFSVSAADFVGVDTAGVRAARGPDGELPMVPFLRLAPGSDLIDAGTVVGLPYEGMLPDLGAFETDVAVAVSGGNDEIPPAASLSSYPNPFNPATIVRYQVPAAGRVRLGVYDLLGREVAVLTDEAKTPGRYEARFDGTGLAGGVYFCALSVGMYAALWKMILLQ